jgi:hypothetical protein
MRDARDMRDLRDFRDLRDSRDFRDHRDPMYDRYRDMRDSRDPMYRYVNSRPACLFVSSLVCVAELSENTVRAISEFISLVFQCLSSTKCDTQ